MAEDKSSFDIVGKAWNTAKIYGGSNAVKKYDAVVESDSLVTLGDFVRDPKKMIETRGIDFDEKADDRLQKYNVVKITPTRKLDEVENPLEMYLITDEHGHDIGIYEVTEKGPKFRLADNILKHNNRIAEKFQGQAKDILKSQYKIENMETLVEKLSKGEEISLSSINQAKRNIKEGYSKKGIITENSEEELSPEEQEEQNALAAIPADMRGEAAEFAENHGLKVKEILVVDSPKELSNEIDNRENQISEYGGPVILIRANHGGADSLGDDVYAFQDGHGVQSEKNDDMLENLMKQHKDEGAVKSLNDDEGDNLEQELASIMEEARVKIEQEEEEISQIQYNMENFQPDDLESSNEIFAQLQSEIDMHQEHIDTIIADRDTKIQALARQRYPLKPFDEKGMEKVDEIHGENEIYDDNVDAAQEAERSRWETADPLANH